MAASNGFMVVIILKLVNKIHFAVRQLLDVDLVTMSTSNALCICDSWVGKIVKI